MKQERSRCDHCQKFVIIGQGTELTMLCTLELSEVDHPNKMDASICGRCFNKHPVEDTEYWTNWLNKRFKTVQVKE